VLIVEDNEENRKLIIDLLEYSHLTIFEAVNGKEAVEIATEYLPDLILMDLRMPVMDGYEATQILKKAESTKSIPIIAISASSRKIMQEDRNKKIFEEYLFKPLDASDLFERMKKYLKYKIVEMVSGEKAEGVSIKLTEEQKILLPKLVYILENEFLPIYHQTVNSQMIDQIEQFGKDLVALAKKNNFTPILEYGSEICTLADNFEIDKLMAALHRFPAIVEKLKGMSKEEGSQP
jgi:CheY-like chemotaxis protein